MFRRFRNITIAALLLVLVIPATLFAQGSQYPGPGTQVTITGARGDAATYCEGVTGSAAQTLTLKNPGGGQSNYVTRLAYYGIATGVPTAATALIMTVTGVAGTTPAFAPLASVAPAAGAQGWVTGGEVPLATPIKGLTSTSIAFVGGTAITNENQTIQACYYSAP